MEPKILDMTCGSRSIWFNKWEPHTTYIDRRKCEYTQTFGATQKTRHIVIDPDLIADFRQLPFEAETFDLVVFDPPHIVHDRGDNCWMTHKYGYYATKEEALESVSQGVDEAMRVLKVGGRSDPKVGGGLDHNARDKKSDPASRAVRT